MNNDAKGMFTIHISFSQVWSHKHFTHTKIVILLFIFSESRTKNQRIFAFTWWKFWLFVLCFAYLCMINFVCDVFVTLENAMWTLTLQFMATGAEWGTVSLKQNTHLQNIYFAEKQRKIFCLSCQTDWMRIYHAQKNWQNFSPVRLYRNFY